MEICGDCYEVFEVKLILDIVHNYTVELRSLTAGGMKDLEEHFLHCYVKISAYPLYVSTYFFDLLSSISPKHARIQMQTSIFGISQNRMKTIIRFRLLFASFVLRFFKAQKN